MYWTNSQTDGFQSSEGTFNPGQGFVISDALCVGHVVFAKRGANDIDAVQCGFLGDAVFDLPERKRGVGNFIYGLL